MNMPDLKPGAQFSQYEEHVHRLNAITRLFEFYRRRINPV